MIKVESTNPNELVLMALEPVILGRVREINGKQYCVVSNDTVTLVTYSELK